MIDAYYKRYPDKSRVRKGNKLARERMAILYDFSSKENALVIGTGNKTEALLGYCTVHGDAACAFNPIGDLYKTQVRLLAKELGVPQKIIDKVPSADLWKGQTDEGELGVSYEEVDRFLYHLVDRKHTPQKLTKLGYRKSFIEKIKDMMRKNEFKRRMPEVLKIPYDRIKTK
jgi:NAD+ synthase